MFFSKNQIFLKKIFLVKSHWEGPKMIFSQKKIFLKKNFFFEKRLRKISQLFFPSIQKKNFSKFFGHFPKKKIMSRNHFGTILMGFR